MLSKLNRYNYRKETFRRRWKDDIRMNLKEMGINKTDWVNSAEDRDYWKTLENTALNLRVP